MIYLKIIFNQGTVFFKTFRSYISLWKTFYQNRTNSW